MIEQIAENTLADFKKECRSLDGEEYCDALELLIEKLRQELYTCTNES